MWCYFRKLNCCIECKSDAKRHESFGLCTTCYARKRALNKGIKQRQIESARKYYAKIKDTDEYKAKRTVRKQNFKQTDAYQSYLKRFYASRTARNFILSGRSGKGLVVVIDGQKVQTNIQPPKNDSEQDTTFKKVELFKKTYKKLKNV